jgi:hypothetical protein
MTTLLILTILLFVAYTALTCCLAGGLPYSYSDSFYAYEARGAGLGYSFTVWCFVTGIAMMAMMLQLSEGQWWQFLGFLAGGGLCFVGAAPLFKSREKVIHSVSAGVCAFAASLWMIQEVGLRLACALPLLITCVVWKPAKAVFIIECMLFISMFAVLIYLT